MILILSDTYLLLIFNLYDRDSCIMLNIIKIGKINASIEHLLIFSKKILVQTVNINFLFFKIPVLKLLS